MSVILTPAECTDAGLAGSKAVRLAALQAAGFDVPAFFVVAASACDPNAGELPAALQQAVTEALQQLCPDGCCVAVRSSATDEDGSERSFAGQLDSHLGVTAALVPDAIVRVWRSAASERVIAYRRSHNLPARAGVTAVVVQRQLSPQVAGVAFGGDPGTGRRAVAVIEAVKGLGDALMSGAGDGDLYRVHRDGHILERHAVAKEPALPDEQIGAVADLAWKASRLFGRPQDVEWAIEDGRLYALQARPLTTLQLVADPDATATLWDNSNVAESYPGVTLPLTFSFARHAYEAVYREFCRLVGVPETALAEHDDTFARMIGSIEGRVYYNLFSWYRLLATLPGFALNRRFMEQMMGVSEGIPDSIVATHGETTPGGKLRDAVRVARTLAGLTSSHFRLRRSIEAFHTRVDRALAEGPDPDEAPAETLVADYRRLERTLLKKWDAPLVNDFFAMIFYGVLRRLTQKWCGDEVGTLQNGMLAGRGRMISAEPARLIERIALAVRAVPELADALCDRPVREALIRLERSPDVLALYRAYLDQFGDRTFEELKLESVPLSIDPEPLLRAIGRTARSASAATRPRATVQPAVQPGSPIRRAVFGWVLRHAGERIRDRENLRYQRTRVFARVRRILRSVGREMEALGVLGAAADIFYLHIDEVLGFVEGTAVSTDLRGLVAVRRAEYDRYRNLPSPDNRIETHGIPYLGQAYRKQRRDTLEGEERIGIGSCPGEIEGVVSVVTDPRNARPPAGAILVAERTDPAWILLFQSAAGVIVERGSLLSHSAVVARELGLPAIVGVDGATSWLKDGDRVRMNGRTGKVQRLGEAAMEARYAR